MVISQNNSVSPNKSSPLKAQAPPPLPHPKKVFEIVSDPSLTAV